MMCNVMLKGGVTCVWKYSGKGRSVTHHLSTA